MKIILHIGMPKTGTTSIQKFCHDNRANLHARGIYYPTSTADEHGNHVKLPAYAGEDNDITLLRKDLGVTDQKNLDAFRLKVIKQLTRELTAQTGKTILFSSENCSLLPFDSEVQRVWQLLSSFTSDITIIFYARDQIEVYSELHSTRVVRGEAGLPLDLEPDPALLQTNTLLRPYDYLEVLDRWAACFGAENIIVRPFEHNRLVGGDVVKDLLHVLGVEDLHQPGIDENKAASQQCVEFMEYMYAHLPRHDGKEPNANHHGIGDVVKRLTPGPAYRPPVKLHALRSLFEASNAAVARKYLGREDGVLFETPPVIAEEDPPPLRVEEAVEIAAKLWVDQWDQRLALMEHLQKFLESNGGLFAPASPRKRQERGQRRISKNK